MMRNRLEKGRTVVRVTGVAAVAVLAACASSGASGANSDMTAEACAPVTGALPADATFEGRSGTYRIVAVAPDGRSTEGQITLVTRSAGSPTLSQATLPLEGTAEIDFAAIGGAVPVGMDSTDSARPGVLVVESEASSGPRILMRFGSRMNDLAQPPFDGVETRLEPLRVGSEGFAGTWRTTGNGVAASGHFCAWTE